MSHAQATANGGSEVIHRGLTESETLTLIAIGVALLVLFAFGIGISVFFNDGSTKRALRQMAGRLVSSLWAIPAVFIVGYLAVRAAPYFLPATPRAEVVAEPEPLSSDAAAHSVADSDLPDWVQAGNVKTPGEQDGWHVVASQQFATVEEANAQAIHRAAQFLERRLDRRQPSAGPWYVPKNWIRSNVLQKRHLETISRQSGEVSFKVHRVYLGLETTPRVWNELVSIRHRQMVRHRLWILGSLLALVTLILATTAAYLRLDNMTGGKYRLRLKLAAVSLILAGGILVELFLPLV